MVSENELKIKEKINPLFISYERKYSKDNKLWWPFKLFYGGKKYYPNSNEKYLANKNTTIINYFCVNHRINTANKKLLFGIYRCNGKIEFNRITEEFFLVRNHNKICDKRNLRLYDNYSEIETNICNFEEYKNELINFLNNNPLISIYAFKKHALKLFLSSNNKFNFTLKKSTLDNIYYPWRTNSKIFSCFSIFDNVKTFDDEMFLRDERTCYINDIYNNNKFYWHKHILWISPLYIKILQESDHLYIDCTYISTKEYYQMLVIMAYNVLLDMKIPCAYILLNNKLQNSYEIVLNNIKNIITENNTFKINLISISHDFEEALINAIKNTFINIRNVGCLYHYIKNIRLNMKKIHLFQKDIKEICDRLLKDLGTIPFKIHNNNNIINIIFDTYKAEYNYHNYYDF